MEVQRFGRFEPRDTRHDGIIFVFYTGLPHLEFLVNLPQCFYIIEKGERTLAIRKLDSS
jgi:hypothetical protein